MLFELDENLNQFARIRIVGIGGCGCNAVNNMIHYGIENVEFYAANTDSQALAASKAPTKIQLGAQSTKGLGAGANPDIGRGAAMESIDQIRETVDESDMVFIAAGMGGGTGTGGAPIVAEVAREAGALTVAVITKPFAFEARKKMKQAEEGIKELRKVADTVITIPNQRLLSIADRNTSMHEAFKKADDVLYQAVKGISDVITIHGIVNVDFADVKTIMSEMGLALMGSGIAEGESRAVDAARKAISSPLLEDISIQGARGVLINVTGSSDMTLHEINDASSLIQEEAHPDANIIFGAVIDESMHTKMRVTVIATGFGKEDTKGLRGLSHPPTGNIAVSSSVPGIGSEGNDVRGHVKVAVNGGVGFGSDNDYDDFDTPTFIRKQAD